MTAHELLAELSRVQDAFTWRLTQTGYIRGFAKNQPDERHFDPITAIAYLRTGEFFPEGLWTAAATAIDLEYSSCAQIVAACNYKWDSSCPQGALRRQLLHSLMLDMEIKTPERDSSFLVSLFLRNSRFTEHR